MGVSGYLEHESRPSGAIGAGGNFRPCLVTFGCVKTSVPKRSPTDGGPGRGNIGLGQQPMPVPAFHSRGMLPLPLPPHVVGTVGHQPGFRDTNRFVELQPSGGTLGEPDPRVWGWDQSRSKDDFVTCALACLLLVARS